MPINEEEVDKMFKEIDIDGSGTIDYTEFVMATMNEKTLLTNDKMDQAFKMFDKVSVKKLVIYEILILCLFQDGSGTISADEIKEVLGYGANVAPKIIDDIIKEVDENGDGQI